MLVSLRDITADYFNDEGWSGALNYAKALCQLWFWGCEINIAAIDRPNELRKKNSKDHTKSIVYTFWVTKQNQPPIHLKCKLYIVTYTISTTYIPN